MVMMASNDVIHVCPLVQACLYASHPPSFPLSLKSVNVMECDGGVIDKSWPRGPDYCLWSTNTL